ncbi:unnamed protein product [Periconia digitata]|uniref:Heterokaryon incompatibility domain-containing protein n=1 Tax=Periconia digitata TaxID=1303443 RepID=A0A9W4U4R0_9PLEO|nr:unnamed protein product [Periconia digitata]
MELSVFTSTEMHEIMDDMCTKGWCIHQVKYLSQVFEYDDETMRYLANLPRSSQRPESHEKCRSELSCVAYNVDLNNYETRHHISCDGSNCEDVAVPYDNLVRLIRDGCVPLVTLHKSDQSRFSIKVHKRQKRTSYTAISHVWADGLGNPHNNSLPSCQLEKLIETETHFWMDTLCIPVRPEDADLRQKSINSMASIYAGARTTLVLDYELMQTSPDTPDCLARIICSVWMRRSWTLQEALLPPECKIQLGDERCIIFATNNLWFGDSPMMWSDTKEAVKLIVDGQTLSPNNLSPRVWSQLQSYLCRQFMSSRGVMKWKNSLYRFKESHRLNNVKHRFEQILGSGSLFFVPRAKEDEPNFPTSDVLEKTESVYSEVYAHTFVCLWNTLVGRSTSIPEDQLFILANTLDMQSEGLINLNSEEQLQTIILSLPSIPLFLFFWQGPKQNSAETPLNHWIPMRIDRPIIKHGPTLRFMSLIDGREGHFMMLEPYPYTRCILLSHTQQLRDNESIHLRTDEGLYTLCIEKHFTDAEELCIVVNWIERANTPGLEAAMFRVLSRRSQKIYLGYHCAVTIEDETLSPIKGRITLQAAFADPATEIVVEYNKPNIPTLRPHGIELPPLITLVWRAMPSFVFSWTFASALYLFIRIVELNWWQRCFFVLVDIWFVLSPIYALPLNVQCAEYLSHIEKRRWRYVESFLPSPRS